MPTTRPRHFVTETDDLARALDEAAGRWPDLSRAQLIVRLALEGDRAVHEERQDRLRRRADAVRRHSGSLDGLFAADSLLLLRDDWPS